ncbi:MAG: PQQ-binding-like beta-propeller repeat protein [Candidatus Zhuqueibacterota bacterium]
MMKMPLSKIKSLPRQKLILSLLLIAALSACDVFTNFEPPQVRIISPKQDEIVYGNVDIIVEATDDNKIDRVELYLDGSLAKTLRQASFSYHWDLNETKADTIHSVCAKAFDGHGNFNEVHVEFWGFKTAPTPNLLSPALNQKVYFDSPRLIWASVPNTERFHLELDDNSDFSTPFISDDNITDTSYIVPMALPYRNYYWRIRTKQPVIGWCAWSSASTFDLTFYRWKFCTAGEILTCPAIDFDGTIYFGSSDYYLHALTPDGAEKWRFQTGGEIESSPAVGPEGTIYFGCIDRYVYALNRDGSLKWKYLTNYQIKMAPAIGADGTIYIGMDNTYFHAFTPDGELKWTYRTHSVCQSPVIGSDGTIYLAGVHYLYALNPDGSLKWEYGSRFYNSFRTPVIDWDGIIYTKGCPYLYAFFPDGDIKWKINIAASSNNNAAISVDGLIIVGDSMVGYRAINPSGAIQWTWHTSYGVGPMLIGSDGSIYWTRQGTDEHAGFFVIDANGQSYKEIFVDENVRAAPAMGNDGTIYVGTMDGNLYAIPSNSSGLANSPWPKFQHDNQNTGRAGN